MDHQSQTQQQAQFPETQQPPEPESHLFRDKSAEKADILKALETSVSELAENGGETVAEPEKKPERVKSEAKEPEAETEPEKAAPPATSRLAKILKEREQARDLKLETEKLRAEAEQARREALELQEKTRAERARWEALKSDPIKAFGDLGLDPEDFVDRVIKQGTPEWKALSKQEQAYEALKAEMAELKAFRVKQEEEAKKWQEQAMRQRQQQAYTQFLQVASEDKCPHLRTLYTEKEILRWGDEIADQYQAKTGSVASFDDIAQYMEEVVSERYQKVSAKPKQATSKAAKTLTGKDTSERRAAPKPRHEMSPTEERRMLLEEAEAVRKNYKKD